MVFATQSAIGNPALAGASALRRPFTAVRSAPRSLVVRAEQGPNDAAMKTIGAIAAAQIALLPLSGAAMADAFPAMGAINSNPAEAFANKAKSAGNKAKAAVAPNPIETLNAKTKAVAQDAKGTLAKNGLTTPDPVKELANKAKAATKNVSSNPAADFANKGKKAAAKLQTKAGPTAKKAVNKAAAVNPAKEFAAKAKQAKNKATGGPLSGIPVVGTIGLQQDVLFGFGEKKIQQVQRSAGKAVDQAADAGQAAAGKAADAGQDIAQTADKATPSSFSIFDASSVQDAREKLKANIEEAAATKSDPAERVASIGKPGESQEENAERIRREAENGNVSGGDARAPTDGGAPAQ